MTKRLFTLAIMSILALSAWAGVTLTGRTATNELFRLERQGADNTYFISGGTLTKSDLGSTTDITNVWYINSAARYIKIDLPTGVSFQTGDIISIYGAHNQTYNASRGMCISSVAPSYDSTNKVYTHSNVLINMSSSYVANTLETISYTVQSGDIFDGQSSLYIAPDVKNKVGVQKVIITHTGADDLVPNAVSNKTWDFATLFSSTSNNSSFESSIVNDDLYYAKSTNVYANGTSKYPRFTSEVSNNLDFTTMEKGVAFMLASGKGIVTVYQISENTPRFYTKSGASATQLTFTAGSKDNETGLTPHYYTYNTSYDMPLSVVRGGGNTYISKIVVAPESVTTPTIVKTGTNEYTVTPGTSNGGPAVTVSTYYTTDGTTPTSSSTVLPNDGKIAITDGMTQIQVISISDFDAQSAVASQSVSFEPETTDISSATVTLSQNSFPYTGEAQAPSVTSVVINEVTLNAETDYDVNTITSQTNIGNEYTVSVTGKGNYTGTATATWAITRGEGSISFANTSGSVAMGTTDFSVVVTKVGDGTVTYSSGDTSIATIDESSGLVTPVSAGITTITATVTNGTNYDYATTTATYELTVTDSSPAVTEISNVNITGLSAPVKGEALTTKEGLTITTEGVSISSINWSPEATTAAASTEYTATIVMEAASGYQFASEVSVNAISEKDATITRNSDTQISVAYTFDATAADAINVTANGYSGTFDGSGHGITVTADEGATITYRTTDSGDYTLTDNPTYTDVGIYTVYYKVSKAGSDDVEGSKTVTITQKDLNITAKPQTITQGESISTGVNQVEVSGLVDGDALTAITLTPSTVEVTTTGTITPSAAETTKGATNYNITYVEGNLTITNSAPVTHTLTVNVDDASHGSVTIIVAGEAASSGVAVAEGASVSVTATANDGYELDALTVNGTAVDATNITESPEKTYTYSLVMPAEATVIAASFSAIANQELSASVAIDFQDAAEAEENLTFATEATNVYEYASENSTNQSRTDYYPLTNNSNNLPINGKLSWRIPNNKPQPTLEATGIKGNSYPFAIHNLVKNDEIIIVHSGTLTNVTATSGNTFIIGETTVEANGTITSGSAIKVTSVGTHNSIVLKPANNTVISAIYINHEVVVKPEKVSAPTIALRNGFTNRVTITSGVSSYGNNVTTYYTIDGTEPTTESTSFTDNSKNLGPYTQEVTIKAVSISETGLASAITSFVLDPQKFTITLPSDLEGGAVTANKETATEGETVKLTITPADGYYLAQLIADNGVTIDVNNNFKMPAANVTISATFVKKTAENANAIVTEDVKVVDETHATITSVEPESLTETTTVAVSGTVNNVPVTAIENGAFASLQGSNVQSVDLSSTQVALEGERSTNSVLKDIPENTLVYLPCTSSNVTGNNVIIYDGEGTAASDYTCNNFVMTDTKSYSVPQPFTATNATLSRSFTSGVTCTVCLPYDVPAGNLDGNIYQFSEVNGTTVKMTQKEGGLVANTPYIFVPSGNVTQITATSVTINMSGTPNTSPDGQSFTFKGVFEHKDFTTNEISDGIYGFAADANHGALSVGQFVKASNGAWTEGMRAYLAYSGSLSETEVASTRGEGLPDVLNVVLIHANGSTTNIGSLELMTADDGSPVYNLNGQRVDNSYKGLVIKNGKKVVKK